MSFTKTYSIFVRVFLILALWGGIFTSVEAQAVEAQTVEAQAVEAQAVEAQTVEAQTVEAQAVEAQTVEAQTVEAQTVEAQTVEASAGEILADVQALAGEALADVQALAGEALADVQALTEALPDVKTVVEALTDVKALAGEALTRVGDSTGIAGLVVESVTDFEELAGVVENLIGVEDLAGKVQTVEDLAGKVLAVESLADESLADEDLADEDLADEERAVTPQQVTPQQVTPQQVAQAVDSYKGLSDSVTNAFGTSVSPGLIMALHGTKTYLTSSDKKRLPWQASPLFFIPFGIITFLIFLKDAVPFLPGAIKSFFTSAETLLMPIQSLIGFVAVITPVTAALTPISTAAVEFLFQSGVAYAQSSAALADSSIAMTATIGGILAAVAGTIIYWVVFCVSCSFNVLCILAPSFAGSALKSIRVGFLAIVYTLVSINTALGLAFVSLFVIVCFILARWSFRFSVWGMFLAFDMLTFWRRKRPIGNRVFVFAGSDAPSYFGIPKRSIGFLLKLENSLVFRCRRYFLFPKNYDIPSDNLTIGSRVFAPVLITTDANGQSSEIFTFRLKLRSHEALLAKILGARGVSDVGAKKAAKSTLAWLRSLRKNDNIGECEAV